VDTAAGESSALLSLRGTKLGGATLGKAILRIAVKIGIQFPAGDETVHSLRVQVGQGQTVESQFFLNSLLHVEPLLKTNKTNSNFLF